MYHQNREDIFNSQMLSNNVEKIEEFDIHILSVNSNLYDEQKSYSDYYLNEDEQNRAQRFRFRKHHDLFVIGRYITRIMIAYYTESTPESVKIMPDSFGKPTCEMDLFFNISHSDDQLLLGFSNSEIGVDIEKTNPAVDVENIGRRHFCGTEFHDMMHRTGSEKTEAFYEIWTKKESLIKGIGKGLRLPLQNFNVTSPNGKVLWEFPTENNYGNWFVQNIETNQGLKSAFATQNEIVHLSYFCHEN